MKFAVVTLAVLLALLAGCGGGDDDEEPARTQPGQAATAADEAPPPNDRTQALEKFIGLSYKIAVAEADTSGQFNDEGKDLLRDADRAWQEYVDRVRRPKEAIARMMVQAYGPTGLDEPADAAEAAEIVAQIDPSAQAYLELVQHAARAGQTRKADLAARKAIELAPSGERAEIRQLVEQAKLTPTP
jgi:hypothetical protein